MVLYASVLIPQALTGSLPPLIGFQDLSASTLHFAYMQVGVSFTPRPIFEI